VFQNVQKHISQKPDCMAYAQAWRQVAFGWSILYPICLLFSFIMLKLYLLLLHFTGQTAVTIYIATGIWLVPTTTVIGTHNMVRVLANSGAPGGQLRLLLLLQSQLHWLPLPNNAATMPHQHCYSQDHPLLFHLSLRCQKPNICYHQELHQHFLISTAPAAHVFSKSTEAHQSKTGLYGVCTG
jgi:hypothetical protein